MKFIDLKTQALQIESNILERIRAIMRHGAFIMGPEHNELEDKLASYVGTKHALGVASGTDALLIALMALDIGPGDEVITTPFSFFATVEVIALLGATPIFVDIDPTTYNMDANLLEKAITSKTKAIMPVSLYGQCPDYDAINAIASQFNLPVIEDAAQSFGAKYKNTLSCGLTTIGCTSFFPTKPLGCYGDGGAIFTSDDALAERMKEIRNHGQKKRYYHTGLGINGRLDTIQAAILLEKLPLFDDEIEKRQQVAHRYDDLLPRSVVIPKILPHNLSAYAQYTIQVKHRDDVAAQLQQRNIPTAVHYPLGLHQQPIFKSRYPQQSSFPHAEHASENVLCLPMHPYLTLEEQQAVVIALAEIL